MSFKLIKKLDNGTRIGELATPHGKIETPFFMPVGTVGSVKSVSPNELKELGSEIILSNTYHLYLRPGEKLIKDFGGLHKFMRWDRPILTDSGGYQVFSLARGDNHNKNVIYGSVIPAEAGIQKTKELDPRVTVRPRATHGRGEPEDDTIIRDSKRGLVKITEEGVEFKSFLDGSKHFFTPEKVIQIQLDLGVDILMPLDVCPSGKATRKEVEESVRLTILWAKRAKEYFDCKIQETRDNNQKNNNTTIKQYDNRPLLHGIVQGGLYEDLRRECAKELIKLDFDGYSVGGLAVDHETRDMWETVKLMGEILPQDKQRYLMGVGTPDDIIKATELGMDMFDCVLPTRLARHGNVYVRAESQKQKAKNINLYELINLLKSEYRTDRGVIDENCGCEACQKGTGFSKAYISHLIRSNEILGLRLATLHNLYQYLELMRELGWRVERGK